jgi:DNA polymerase III subunit delta'
VTWDVVGHERAVDLLRRSIEHGRLGHAYLFSGPDGVGKRTLALELARAVNCETAGPGARPMLPGLGFDDPAEESGGDGGPPCGACRRCRLIAEGKHPEVRVVGVEPPHKVIRVADVESIQADAALRPADAYRKVYVIDGAELLHVDAANRLLKTIEEPPPSVMLVLTTVDPEATLETIVSRCQHVRLHPLPPDRLAHELGRRGLSPERAALLAALAEGAVGRALALAADEAILERRARHLDDLADLLAADRVERLQYARTLGDRWSGHPETVREVLATWLRWWRDVLLLQKGAPNRAVNVDRLADLERHAALVSPAVAAGAVSSLRDTLAMLDQNVNARLALDVALLDLPRPARAA